MTCTVVGGQKKGLCRKLLAMMATSWERTLSFIACYWHMPCSAEAVPGKQSRRGKAAQGKTSHPTGPALDRAGKKCENAGRDGENLWLFLGSSPSGVSRRHFLPVLSRVASGCRKKRGG